MSPEQTRLLPLDRRSDVFSLGVIGWELLTGERLFAHRDPLEAVRLVQHAPVPAPTALRADVPPGIGEVILRALERDRGARVQSAGELALLLRRAARASYGEPPHKKEITAFVEHGGGEDLSRLQRLIRLGTEGAGAEAIEAVQPGVTRVLPEDASGVAPVGTGARRTAVLDSGAEELGPPTVMIVSDPAAVPETRLARTAEVRADPYAAETRSVRSAEVPTDPYVPETRADTARDEPVTRPSRAADDLTAQVTRVATPLAKAARREPSRGPWIAVAAIICALSFGAGLALVVVWPSDPPAAVLPAVVPTPQAPAPPLPTPVVREAAPDPPPPAQARPAAESEPPPPALEAEEPTTSSRAPGAPPSRPERAGRRAAAARAALGRPAPRRHRLRSPPALTASRLVYAARARRDAVPRRAEVDAWFRELDRPLAPVMQRVREALLAADPRVDECIKWKTPTFTYEGNIASFNPRSKQHVSLLFHTGAHIPGTHPRLEGGGDTARYMKIADLADADAARSDLKAIVRDWIESKSTPATAKKPTAKKPAAKKTAAKKTAAKKTAAKKTAAKKTAAKKTAAKKPAATQRGTRTRG
ncbi:MAG: DUF1801 domain-containing protein [Sandaracinaceae bacterium]|nr:DUF1801 domain-containing protein [Sandaracinaceae bacterium]